MPKAPPFLHPSSSGCRLEIYVAPRASRTALVGVHDNRLKIAIKSPPVDGAANKELIRFLASILGIPKRDISIEKGASGRRKTLHAEGLQADEILAQIPPLPNRIHTEST